LLFTAFIIYFLQAEDGIRGRNVTGVQTCALPILAADPRCVAVGETGLDTYWIEHAPEDTASLDVQEAALRWHADLAAEVNKTLRSEERRVGKEYNYEMMSETMQKKYNKCNIRDHI